MQQSILATMFKLKPHVKPRLYQELITATAVKANTLVVLPTGLGKTLISLLMALHRTKLYPGSKVLILAPTRPLVNQHLQTFKDMVEADESSMAVFTGQISPEKRADLFVASDIIFSTPQGLENDILASRIKLSDISLLVFDEAHRATGDYSYVWVAEQYMKQAKNPLILALTASPGSDLESITEICQNLSISQIEYREMTSPDVEPYIQKTKVDYVEVDLPPEFVDIATLLKKAYSQRISQIKSLGFLEGKNPSALLKTDLLKFVGALQQRMAQQQFDPAVASGISLAAQALKISHAVELIESQGVQSLYTYLQSMYEQAAQKKSKAVVSICADPHIRLSMQKTKELISSEIVHPKMKALLNIVDATLRKSADAKIILFSQYRDSLVSIVEQLNTHPKVNAKLFVGQAKKQGTGMSQKEQLAMLADFKDGDFNVICMSSVGEEGLDIPSVDTVIFFEPIPSAIRTIQRKGRTGRHDEGRVVILCARNTRDMAFRYVAQRKEKNMYEILKKVKAQRSGAQQTLRADFVLAKTATMSHTLPLEPLTTVASQTVATHTVESVTPQTESATIESQMTEIKLEKKTMTSIAVEKPSVPVAEQKVPKTENSIVIFADHREKGSGVLKQLFELPIALKLEQLAVGDFTLSKDVVVEYKRVPDFIDSILDGRLLTQLKILRESVLKPVVIIEGEESLFSVRNIHPNSIYGMLSTVAVSYQIPILFTRNEKETASLLFMIARREQQGSTSSFSPHASNKPASLREQQEYVISSIPHVGMSTAKKLLEHFGCVQNILICSVEALAFVDGIGKQKAQQIKDFLKATYK
ncbi:MAG TPA: DEAD/DEAH box helicase [Acidobacteriota bacterium]|nr:DEAD/DEAH box helicase [Acidobacteriota bacterium]